MSQLAPDEGTESPAASDPSLPHLPSVSHGTNDQASSSNPVDPYPRPQQRPSSADPATAPPRTTIHLRAPPPPPRSLNNDVTPTGPAPPRRHSTIPPHMSPPTRFSIRRSQSPHDPERTTLHLPGAASLGRNPALPRPVLAAPVRPISMPDPGFPGNENIVGNGNGVGHPYDGGMNDVGWIVPEEKRLVSELLPMVQWSARGAKVVHVCSDVS